MSKQTTDKLFARISYLESENKRQRDLIEQLQSQVAAASETCPGCQLEPNQIDM